MARVLALLFLSVFINYVDRSNLSIAAPMIKDELQISASQLGLLLSAFFWTYAGFQIISGWLADRFGACWLMAGGFLVWSVATAWTGIVQGFAVLLVARVVLGMGESVMFPAFSKIVATHFTEQQRGLANSVVICGLACGPAFGLLLGGMLMERFHWRPFFIGLGLVSLLWLPPWLKWMPRGEAVSRTEAKDGPGLFEILRQRSAWGASLGLFCMNYQNYFLLTWFPFYLVRQLHFSLTRMAQIGAAAYLLSASCTMTVGWLSDRWIVRGGTPTRARKTFMGIGTISAAVFLGSCAVVPSSLTVIFLVLSFASFGICSSNLWAISHTLSGPQAAGKWTGLQNFLGNMAGVVAPALTGYLLDRTGQFAWAFAVTAGVALLGMIAWIFIVGPVERIEWGQQAADC